MLPLVGVVFSFRGAAGREGVRLAAGRELEEGKLTGVGVAATVPVFMF